MSEIEKKQGKPVYRVLKFVVVQYGDDPEEYLEASVASDFEDLIGMGGPIGFRASGLGRVIGFRVLQGRYSSVHSFDDYDAAASNIDPSGR